MIDFKKDKKGWLIVGAVLVVIVLLIMTHFGVDGPALPAND